MSPADRPFDDTTTPRAPMTPQVPQVEPEASNPSVEPVRQRTTGPRRATPLVTLAMQASGMPAAFGATTTRPIPTQTPAATVTSGAPDLAALAAAETLTPRVAPRISLPKTPAERRINIGSTPKFSWSHSRDQLLSSCERNYYEHYYGAHLGWEVDAAPRAQLAYRLKQLSSPFSHVGRAVHRRATEIALAIRQGLPTPSLELLVARTHEEIDPILRRGPGDAGWLADPKRFPITRDAYYNGRSRGEAFDRLIDRVAIRITAHLSALLASPIWLVAQEPGAAIVIIDEMSTYRQDGVTTYVTPDLVIRRPSGTYLVVDWKAGEGDEWRDQLGLYARSLEHSLSIDVETAVLEMWVVHLDRDAIEAERVTPAHLIASEARQRDSVAKMQGKLADVDTNTPLTAAAFPMAANPNAKCRTCAKFALCRDELHQQAVGPTPNAARAI